MPSDQLGDGGGEWDDENILLPADLGHQQWLPISSGSASNLMYYPSTNYNNPPSFTDASAGALSGVPIANQHDAFFNPTNQSFDFIQAQHWSDQPAQENAPGTTAPVSLNSGVEWTNPLALAESSPRDSIGTVGEVLSKADNDKGPKQDFPISRSLLSPSRSVGPTSKPVVEPARLRRVSAQPQREERRGSRPAQNTPTGTGSGYSTPVPSQRGFDRKKAPVVPPRSTPLTRQLSRNATESQNEDDQRRKQFGLTPRGPSRVSSTSGHSQTEPFSPEVIEDEMSNTSKRPENRAPPRVPGIVRIHQGDDAQSGQQTLPPAKGFSIQIGSENFKLSGASIMSDEHPHTSQSFLKNSFSRVAVQFTQLGHCILIETLQHFKIYVGIYKDIMYNQGMDFILLDFLQMRNFTAVSENLKEMPLFVHANVKIVPRLKSQLGESEIFVQIGGENFQIPRDIFGNTGDTPNFFNLGFAIFFSRPGDAFPGLDSAGLLRPPSVHPPCVPNRSAKVFAEILHLLRGYPLKIRSKEHRAELLRDCRYFNLRGLEQRLIFHDISYNAERGTSEIIIRLEDIKPSGVKFVGDASPSDPSSLGGWVNYARPFVDEKDYEIIVEICDESTRIDFRNMRADFYGEVKARISSLFQVVANKMNLPNNLPLGLMMSSGGAAQSVSPGNTPLSEDRVKIRIERDVHIILDGEEYSTVGAGFLGSQSDLEPAEITSQNMNDPPSISVGQKLSPSSNWPTPGPFGQPRPQSAGQAQFSSYLSFPTSPRQQGMPSGNDQPSRKRKRRGSLDDFGEWMIRKGQWRLRVQPRMDNAVGDEGSPKMEIILFAVKLDAISGQKGRNTLRGFLTQ